MKKSKAISVHPIAVLTGRLTVAGLAAMAFSVVGIDDGARLLNIASVLASVSGTLFGFLLTAVALFVALPEGLLVQNMKKTGHYAVLLSDAYGACSLLFALLCFSVGATFLEMPTLRNAITASVFLAVWATLSAGSAGMRFARVLRLLA